MPETLTLTKKSSLYQDIVLRIMSKMDMGSMHLTLPDGQSLTLGNGEGNVSANVSIKSDEFYKQVILYGDIGFGESYVAGLWETDNITNVIKWILLNLENNPTISGGKVQAFELNMLKWFNMISHFKNANSLSGLGKEKHSRRHYDLNNDFFARPSSTLTMTGLQSPIFIKMA